MNIMLGAISRHRREAESADHGGGSSEHAEGYSAMAAARRSQGRARSSIIMTTAGLSLTFLIGAGVVMWYLPKFTEAPPPILPPTGSSLANPGFPMNPTGSSAPSMAANANLAAPVALAAPSEMKEPKPIVPGVHQPSPAVGASAPTPAAAPAIASAAAPLPTYAAPPTALRAAEKPPAQAPIQTIARGAPEPEVRPPVAKEVSGPRLTKVTAQVSTHVDAAWHAMSAGRFQEAEALYARVLNSHPDHVDALVGMASLLHRRGQRDAALNTYRLVLAQAPDNSVALTGTLALLSESDPSTAESRLKDFIDARPQEDGAQVALGHLLGRQGRWSEAQAAFFTAYTLQPHSASHAYNLAVALDHLHHHGEALKYYRVAVAQAKGGEIPLDSTAKRIGALASSGAEKP